MHVAILSPYSFAYPGGVQEYSRGLARALRTLGHEVTLLAPDVGADTTGLDGILTISLGRALRVPANGSIAPIGIDPRMLVRLELSLDPADVLHVQEPFQPASLAAAWRAPRGVPVVGTFHMAAERFVYYRLAGPLLRSFARRLALCTATSDASRGLIRRYVDIRPEVVPNGVDAGAIAAAGADPWAASLGRVVLFFGRAEPRKGLAVMLDAFGVVAASRPNVHLVANVAPEQAPPVPSAVTGRVHLLGRVSHERKLGLFRAADVYCAPQLAGESWGVVVAEAMAAGRAVLASDIPGLRASGGDAVEYAPAGNVAAWAQALGRLLDDEARRDELGRLASARAMGFDWPEIASRFLDVYERAIRGGA